MTNSKATIDAILMTVKDGHEYDKIPDARFQLLQLIKEAMPEKLDKHPQSYKKGELGYDEFREQFLAGLKHGYAKALKDCEANIKALFGSDE